MEIADLGLAGVGVRNSTRPDEALVLSPPVWRDLLESIKAGDLDTPGR